MEIEEDLLDINPFHRVRVLMDVTIPLKRFQKIRIKGDNLVKIIFKYERLPHFCFLCGLISHTEKDCSIVGMKIKNLDIDGVWILGRLLVRVLSKHKVEVDALKLKKSLFLLKPKPSPISMDASVISPNGFHVGKDVFNSSKMKVLGVEKQEAALPVCESNYDALSFNESEPVATSCAHEGNSPLCQIEKVLSKMGSVDVSGFSFSCGTTCPFFQIGKHTSNSKKIIKVKRKISRSNFYPKPSLGNVSVLADNNGFPVGFLDTAIKRKSFNLDVIIEESDGVLKCSCIGSGVSLKPVDDSISSVVGVDVVQPREQI